METSRLIISIAGNFSRRSRDHVDRIISRALNISSIIIFSKPDRTRRITHNLPAYIITTYHSGTHTRTIRRLFSKPIFHICANGSPLNTRVNKTIGGIVTITINITSNVNFNSGAETTLVTHNLTRVAELNITLNTGTRAFSNLDNVKSLIIAYADHRDHGRSINRHLNGNREVSRVITSVRVITRNM